MGKGRVDRLKLSEKGEGAGRFALIGQSEVQRVRLLSTGDQHYIP